MTRDRMPNEAAERLLDDLGQDTGPVARVRLVLLDKALATERRNTVEPFVQLEKRLWADADAIEASSIGSKKARAVAVESLRAAAREVYATRIKAQGELDRILDEVTGEGS